MIKDISKDTIEKLLPLLKTSYPEVTLEDETKYFPEEESLGWCYLEQNDHPTSFLRYFIQGDSPKFAIFEFVIKNNDSSEFESLSLYCISKAKFLDKIMQRFELNEEQKSFIPHLQKLGFNQITTYYTYEKTILEGEINHISKADEKDFDKINEVLKVFQIFNHKKLREYSKQGTIHYLKIDNIVVASAWIRFNSSSIELVEIATHPDHKSKGHAKTLLTSIEHWAYEKGHTKIFLKVKEENLTAVNLYKSLNYNKLIDKTQYWVYKNK